MSDRYFNIRVYGILIQDNHLLITEEIINGTPITKFPGGGLEFGEGTLDCLKREFKEEMNLPIHIDGHFYTTDFFQPSAFGDNQVMSIYYKVSPINKIEALQNLVAGEQSSWLPLQEVFEDCFTLPIDRLVGKMIHEEYVGRF